MISNEMYKERINNPITGETLYVLESNEDTFRIEFAINPKSSIAAEHIHPNQQQTISVIEGFLGCRVDGVNVTLGLGESVVVPPGSSHFQWNPTDTEARAIEEFRPAGRAHSFFRVLFALAREGHTNSAGVPKPLIGAAFVSEFQDFIRPASRVMGLLFWMLGPISSLLGYRQVVREYIERFRDEDIDQTPMIAFHGSGSAGPRRPQVNGFVTNPNAGSSWEAGR